jgi:hypothetical protein
LGRRKRLFSTTASVVVHLAILLALLSAQPEPPKPPPESEAVTVALVDARSLIPKPAPPAPETPSPAVAKPAPAKPAKPRPQRAMARPKPAPAEVAALPAADEPSADPEPGLSDAQLAGAATAESGGSGGGGACNMARWLQGALRKDPLVRAALAGSAGRAIMVWNGDWVRNHGEDGKGLATIREAIMWEVAFAPAACRAQPVHGLVLLSLNEAPGGTRLAVGSGDWRWSDLLKTQAYVSDETSSER